MLQNVLECLNSAEQVAGKRHRSGRRGQRGPHSSSRLTRTRAGLAARACGHPRQEELVTISYALLRKQIRVILVAESGKSGKSAHFSKAVPHLTSISGSDQIHYCWNREPAAAVTEVASEPSPTN